MPKDTSSGQILVSQAYLMLNNLQNKLLIDRIAVTRGFPQSGQRLLNTALRTSLLQFPYHLVLSLSHPYTIAMTFAI
jgi:hypothetical protein